MSLFLVNAITVLQRLIELNEALYVLFEIFLL